MKKILLSTLFVCFAAGSAIAAEAPKADRVITADEFNEIVSKGKYSKDIRYTGILAYDDGKITRYLEMRGGYIEGKVLGFYNDNKKQSCDASFLSSMRHGTSIFYNEDGSENYTVEFVRGKAISGKCANGKAFTKENIKAVNSNKPVVCN